MSEVSVLTIRPERLYSIRAVAGLLGVDWRTVERMVSSGRLSGLETAPGSKPRIAGLSVLRYLGALEEPAEPAAAVEYPPVALMSRREQLDWLRRPF